MLPLEAFYGGRTLNFGHRGARHDAPENTIAAFDLAARYGADGVELDVMLTRDRHIVVIHNSTVDATTDGSGPVRARTLAEIKELDAGSRAGSAFAGERIPTLAEVFEAIGARLLINVELKGVDVRADGLEAAVVALVERHGMAERVIVSSFNPLRLRRMRRIAPHLALGLLREPTSSWIARRLSGAILHGVQPEADHPHESRVTPEYLAGRRRQGQRVNVWTVNEPERMRALLAMGVDMIITDRPDVLRDVMQDRA